MWPGLLAAEQVARSANLEVLHRNRHARAEFGVLRDRGQPVVGRLGERLLRRIKEVRVPALARPPDASAQLMQLREPEHVRPLDDQRVGIGDVQAGLDDRRADEDVVLLLPEADHDLLEGVLAHLPVRDGDARLGHQVGQLRAQPG